MWRKFLKYWVGYAMDRERMVFMGLVAVPVMVGGFLLSHKVMGNGWGAVWLGAGYLVYDQVQYLLVIYPRMVMLEQMFMDWVKKETA